MVYILVLDNGYVHRGYDERDFDALMEEIGSKDTDDDLPEGWVWIAGLYVKRGSIVALTDPAAQAA